MRYLPSLIIGLWIFGCAKPSTDQALSDDQKRSAQFSLSSMKLPYGLEAKLFAHEPMLVNPTNMDIDHLGRIWVCEGHNYRLPLNPDKENKSKGDRILILEDTDLDGKADNQKVFYQGNDVNAALGISVLGNRVFVSKSPNILIFTDTDGDDIADSKEVLFTGMDAADHDHAIHAVVFGPDGKIYFNAGNEIHQIMNPQGTPVIDLAGNEVNDSGNPYRQGMVFRSNLDGSELETLGWNFRNPYELCLDSYGNIWQSDNDDDGNRGTRLNLVMEFGNYGFTDEITGAGWRTKRTGMSEEIPLRHWHLNDPGVVPNLLQLYAGSPTGILFNEGELFPENYRNSIIHAEAGANVIRSYPLEKNGFGYQSSIVEIMRATDDPWFRPSDVCIAPDGSLFVADWYDPGVGGHLVGDQQKGRIFRITPSGRSYTTPTHDFQSVDGLIQALKSPNQAVRYLAWTGLRDQGQAAKSSLMQLFKGENPVFSARSLWLLAQLDASEAFELGKISNNEDLQVLTIKMARQKFRTNLTEKLKEFAADSPPHVKRELAVALRFQQGPEADNLWVELATNYQGDRWFLEALGIGADLHTEARFMAWLAKVGDDWNTGHNKDIVWRTRSITALPLLAKLITEAENVEQTHRYFRAFDFHQSNTKNQTLESLLNTTDKNQQEIMKLVFRHLEREYVLNSPRLKPQLLKVTDSYRGTEDFILTIQRYKLQQYNQDLLDMVLQADENRTNAARLLLENEPSFLKQALEGSDEQAISSVLTAFGAIGNTQSLDLLYDFMMDDNNSLALRQQAAGNYASGWSGQNQMLDLLATSSIPQELIPAAAGAMSASWRPGIRAEAAKYLDIPNGQDHSVKPKISQLVTLDGDIDNGTILFEKFCQTCHVVNKMGIDFGPGLTEIGSKLSKEALYASILNPDAGISFGYEGYLVTLTDGTKITGLIQSRTASELTIKQIGGVSTVYSMDQIETIDQLDSSLMTPNLHLLMDQQELVDLVSYMEQLKSPV